MNTIKWYRILKWACLVMSVIIFIIAPNAIGVSTFLIISTIYDVAESVLKALENKNG